MTDDERDLLKECAETTRDLRAALLEVPVGAGKDAKPLIVDIRHVVQTYQRVSWAVRIVVWLVPTAAVMATAASPIRAAALKIREMMGGL